MNTRTRNAVANALIKAGFEKAVMMDWEYEGDLKLNTEIYINDELGSAGDYYAEFYEINPKIEQILNKYNCYFEWYDCAVMSVYKV